MPEEWPPPVFEPDDVARVHRRLTAVPSATQWTLYYILRQPVHRRLTAVPSATQWTLYYILRQPVTEQGRRVLIGIAGYVNPPTFDGAVEIGYAIAAEHQRHGYATEAVAALLAQAFAASGVRVVVATTYATLLPSIRVLQKTGFVEVARDPATHVVTFESRASTSSPLPPSER